jgi:uncharacterized caspase-like protein
MSLPDPSLSRAIIIGVAEYPRDDSLPPLPSIRNNVADLAAVLTDQRRWGLPAGHCVTLIDPAEASEAMRSVSPLADEAQDTLLFYFAGHGLVAPDGELVLAVANTERRRAEFTGLRYQWVREAVANSIARRRVLILDCCFSGRALSAMADPASVITGQLEIEGTCVLASAPATSPASAPQDARHTAFTGGLLHVLHQGIEGQQEYLSLADIYEQTFRAMARAGRPRPQILDINTVGRLALVRNAAWRMSARPPALRRAPVGRAVAALADGVVAGVAAIRSTLGPTGRDAMTALREVEVAGGQAGAGLALVRELVSAMRAQQGDGAATAAVLAGALVGGLRRALSDGADPAVLEDDIGRGADSVRELLVGMTRPPGSMRSDVADALATAVGAGEIADLVTAAVERVGAANVEIVAAADAQPGVEVASRVTLGTRILSPNAAVTPITLDAPYVVVSIDGRLDAQALVRRVGATRRPLLVIAPKLAASTLRTLLHVFRRTVVVRPAEEKADLGLLLAALEVLVGGPPPKGTAKRAVVTSSDTTIIGSEDRQVGETGRAIVRIGAGDSAAPLQLATRALAVARACGGGVLAGGGAALHAAGLALSDAGPADGRAAGAAVLRAALSEPLRQIVRNGGHDPDAVCRRVAAAAPAARFSAGFDVAAGSISDMFEAGIVDPLATVQGAVGHAVATAARYLTLG